MTNLEKYNEVFISNLRVTNDQLPGLTHMAISTWDSVGQMLLVAALEETFGIMFETEDILDFSSYEDGIRILKNKYKLEI